MSLNQEISTKQSTASPIPEQPSTPVPGHSALPENSPVSPTNPLISLPATSEMLSLPRANHADVEKCRTPALPMSSMTPPPSSQVPKRDLSPSSSSPVSAQGRPVVSRTPIPMTSLLSSPPPTFLADTLRPTEPASDQHYQPPTPEEISLATPEKLRSLVETSNSEIAKLSSLWHEARTLAAHHKLQHNLLSIETGEAVKRMNVEYEMSRREIEALQNIDQTHQRTGSQPEMGSSVSQPNDCSVFGRLALDLRQECQTLKADNDFLNRRLRKAKKLILHREGELASFKGENLQLRQRIMENREHLNRFRRPGGLFDASPRRQNYAPAEKSRPDDSIEAILLADRVLNQGNATAPSTPMRGQNAKPGRLGHSRGAHSLSSLPSTPTQHRMISTIGNQELTPVNLESPRGRSVSISDKAYRGRNRRRESRDSTISAPDIDDQSPSPYREDYDNGPVLDSPASQLATSMLRRSAEQKQLTPKTRKSMSNGMIQPKLFGHVKKPGSQRIVHLGLGKRPNEQLDDVDESAVIDAHKPKKSKIDTGVGLGIGGWGSVQG
ncbi:MAG: hypothetical protein M1837_001781 [Sclerophora amabilis]|nr:MAG: hypothetical protein M1837_001781 [Sclerophora amabilis]